MSARTVGREFAVLLGAALGLLIVVLIAPSLTRTPSPASEAPSSAGELAVVAEWHAEEPPEGEVVLAFWADPYGPKSHVVRRVGGAYYEGRFDASPVRVLEETAPTIWRVLP